MSKKQTSLPISALKDEVSIYDETIEVTTITHNNKDIKIEFHPLFKYESIRKCVLEIGQFYQNAMQEGIEIDPIDEDALIDYFIIRHFSKGLKFTTSKKAKTIHEEFKIVYNSSLYRLFKNEIFTNELVEKSKEQVIEEIWKNIELAGKLENRLKQAQDMIKNLPLENRDIILGAIDKDSARNVKADV